MLQRIVTMIEAEVDRRHREGIAPDPWEAALVAYAMALRASHVDGSSSDDFSNPAADRPSSSLRFQVAMTGAFLTGHPLSTRWDTHRALQQRLSKELRAPRWRTDDLTEHGGTYESGGGFTRAMPLVIARREGGDLIPSLEAALNGFRPLAVPPTGSASPLITATASSLVIDVYDLGVAVLTVWLDVTARGDRKLEAAVHALKEMAWLRPVNQGRSPLVDELERVASTTAREFGDAVVVVAPNELPRAWLSGTAHSAPSRPADDRRTEDHGRLLWLHPVHVVRTPHPLLEQVLHLAPPFRETIDLDGGVFAAGVGWSAVAMPPDSGTAAAPIRLIELHWAYYALYMEIDRGLLDVLGQPRWREHAPLRQLEDDADAVFADYLRVAGARARLDSRLTELGGDDAAVWETIARVQRFDALVDSVDRKLEVLERVAQRRVDLATADRARRTSRILGYLTALTVVTVTGGIIGVVFGSRSPGVGAVELRIGLVIAAIAVATLVHWLTFVRGERATARRRRRRLRRS